MKKIFLVLICLLLVTSYIAADIEIDVGLSAGVNGIINNSEDEEVTGSLLENMGFEIGVFTDIAFSEFLSIQFELNYLRLNKTYSYSFYYGWGGSYTFEDTFTMDLFEIPILAKLNLGNFNLFFGPALSMNITYDGPWEVLWEFGAGYALPVGEYGKLVFDLRFRVSDSYSDGFDTIGLRLGYALFLY